MPSISLGERETIIEHVVDILDEVGGATFVSRNFQLVIAEQVDTFPATFVLDLGDTGEMEVDGRGVHKELLLGLYGVLKGSTGELAPKEMSNYLRWIKKAFWTNIFSVTYSGSPVVREATDEGTSPLKYFAKIDRVVHQGIQFRLRYIESVVDLVNE
jgi:hypothetical protein